MVRGGTIPSMHSIQPAAAKLLRATVSSGFPSYNLYMTIAQLTMTDTVRLQLSIWPLCNKVSS